MRVAVFGASGTIGRALLPALAREHDVVAVSRRDRDDERNVRWVAADATDAAAVATAVAGADVVVYLVHSLGAVDFEERDALAARTVAAEAERAGVRQIVYLGGLGDDQGGDGADDASALSPHLRSRADTATALASGAVPVTTLRAAMVVGAGSAAFETIAALVRRLPVMVTPRWVETSTQPIALADVVAYLAGVCGDERALGRTFDVGGPEVMSYREMIERIARLLGRTLRIVPVPVLTPRLSSLWLHLVTPVDAAVARPLVEGLRNPTIARDDSIRELVPLTLTSFDDAARAALAETPNSAHWTIDSVQEAPAPDLAPEERERLYWEELRRLTIGAVSFADDAVRPFGHGPALMRFGPREGDARTIVGGIFARGPAGTIAWEQSDGTARVAVRGFAPRLPRVLYPVQSRLHAAVSRRYFRRLRRTA